MGIESKDEWFRRWDRTALRRHMEAALPIVDRLRTRDPDRAARIEVLLAEIFKEVEDPCI
jgi:hypothetical protein